MKIVLDTNVAIAANGRNTHAGIPCQITCVEFIEMATSAKSNTLIALDSHDLLLEEYRKHLNYRGQPGIGDAFFKYLHDHMHDDSRIILVPVSPNSDENTGFDELPINSVDKSDRKILATAIVAKAEIVNALDSDWHEQSELLTELDINVNQLCPNHACPV